jgi:hypothetical protein
MARILEESFWQSPLSFSRLDRLGMLVAGEVTLFEIRT